MQETAFVRDALCFTPLFQLSGKYCDKITISEVKQKQKKSKFPTDKPFLIFLSVSEMIAHIY